MIWDALDVKESPQGVSFKVKVQPRASRNAITGVIGDCLKLQLTSPPVDGAANIACADFLSDLFGVARSRIMIMAGDKSRNKVIQIAGITKSQFMIELDKISGK